jgi:spermidine synthase
MIHEVSDKKQFFSQIYSLLKKSGRFLVAEPKMHVSKKEFTRMLNYARKAGFSMEKSPYIFLSRSVLFFKKEK